MRLWLRLSLNKARMRGRLTQLPRCVPSLVVQHLMRASAEGSPIAIPPLYFIMFHVFTESLLQRSDLFRFEVKCVEELYSRQPPENAQYSRNRLKYRPLEGFVLAASPFNFTAIGCNLAGAPALVGNVVYGNPHPQTRTPITSSIMSSSRLVYPQA